MHPDAPYSTLSNTRQFYSSRRDCTLIDPAMYHERQRLQFCALHVLNNLFQDEVFSKPELDDICYSLNPDATINPHKSMFGLGNYDVNVLTMALQLKDFQLIWFDKRK